MQINTGNNLPIIADYNRHQRSNLNREQPRQSRPSTDELPIIQPQNNQINSVQRVRPTVNATPIDDQQLSQTGEQARRLYQDIALAGNDVELAHRLDVIV
jgi:hypothetical protein